MIIILYVMPRSPSGNPAGASAPPGFESMADDDELRARARDIFGVIWFRLPGFNWPVILRHRLERTQKVTAICRDFPPLALSVDPLQRGAILQ